MYRYIMLTVCMNRDMMSAATANYRIAEHNYVRYSFNYWKETPYTNVYTHVYTCYGPIRNPTRYEAGCPLRSRLTDRL